MIPSIESLLAGLARRFVMALDTLLRRIAGIIEFCDEPACLLRLGSGHSDTDILLSDGTHIHPGDPVGEIHLWNEHVPRMGSGGPDLGWGVQFYRGMLASLEELSAYVQTDDRFASVKAFRGEVAVLQNEDVPVAAQLLERLGFDIQYLQAPAGWLDGVERFWSNLYTWWLMWTFQPASLRGKALAHVARFRMWISHAELVARYGSGGDDR